MYARVIESLIEDSNNYKCPKIQANYDEFEDSNIRPLNSTIFYFYFSGNRYRKAFAQFMLAGVRFPNEKLRKAYMRFFA